MITLKNILRVLMVLCLICPMPSMAEEHWCAVTDNNHIVALSNISYLASEVGESKFNVVLNDGTAIEEVESMMFAKFHIDGVEEATLGSTTQLSFRGDKILISNAPIGATLSISSLEGRNIICSTIHEESQLIDISELSTAIYVLNVGGKTIKFRKL